MNFQNGSQNYQQRVKYEINLGKCLPLYVYIYIYINNLYFTTILFYYDNKLFNISTRLCDLSSTLVLNYMPRSGTLCMYIYILSSLLLWFRIKIQRIMNSKIIITHTINV